MSDNNRTSIGKANPAPEKGARVRSLKSPTEAIKPEAVPPPPPRRRRERGGFVNGVSNFLTAIVVGAIAIGGGVYVLKSEFNAAGPLPADKVVMVKGGARAVADALQREGVISQPTLFLAGVYISGVNDDVKAGEYLFRKGASLREVMDTLVSGKTVLHNFTVPEGLTSEQIVARLREVDLLTGDIAETPPEGALLPETYRISRGASRQQILDRMRQDGRRVLAEVWARRAPDLPLKTPEEMVTLASIVEKETGRADERTRVAGVFINRLQKGMRLQSDPTIVYGIAGGKGALGRPLSRADITTPTPYNTYTINGLPPGPIANPGRAALEAVANPSRTRDLYFVADGSGGHTFAETLDQHNRGVSRLRQMESDRRAQGNSAQGNSVPDNAAGKPADGSAGAVAPQQGQADQPSPSGRPRAFDASEGTDKDPLRNKTYDLNSPQVVPKVR
ncbi:endolytic transglycosylase MltG [Camelimonas sp. ID_303_24]